MEYLYHWYDQLMNNRASRVVLDGDSTTKGDVVIDQYKLQNLLPIMLGPNVPPLAFTNIGVNGADMAYWQSTGVAAELAQSPDLLIVRYGLNGQTTLTECRRRIGLPV